MCGCGGRNRAIARRRPGCLWPYGAPITYVVAVLGLSQVLVETTGGETMRYVFGHDLLAGYDGMV